MCIPLHLPTTLINLHNYIYLRNISFYILIYIWEYLCISSRNINVDMAARSVRLRIERSHGQGYRVAATYNTQQLNNNIKMGGVNIYPALDGEDFRGASGTVVFEANQQVPALSILFVSITRMDIFYWRYAEHTSLVVSMNNWVKIICTWWIFKVALIATSLSDCQLHG